MPLQFRSTLPPVPAGQPTRKRCTIRLTLNVEHKALQTQNHL